MSCCLSVTTHRVNRKRLVKLRACFKEKYIQMKTYGYVSMVRKGEEAAKRHSILEISFNKDCSPEKSL